MAIRRVTSRNREAESSLGILLVPGQAGVPTPRLTVEEILGMESVPEQKKALIGSIGPGLIAYMMS